MEQTEKKAPLDCWAIVELMGHQRIAGRVTERNVAGTQMLQVDVPAVGEAPAFSRLLGGSAIFAINPCDEETANAWAGSLREGSTPLLSWDGRKLVSALVEKRLAALPGPDQVLPGLEDLDEDDGDEDFTE